jgi:Predicted nucleic acid-binding protein, contains PIN domain
MVVSPVHFKEIEAIEDTLERLELTALLNKYSTKPSCDLNEIRKRAEELHTLKFGVADAAHIAFAEKTSDLFITCDDKLLKKCSKSGVRILAMSPVEFCLKEDLR